MALYQVSVNGVVRADDLNQIVQVLTGASNEPIAITGVNSASEYALSLQNQGSGGKALTVSGASHTLLRVNDSDGVRASVDGSSTLRTLVGTQGAQTLQSKTLDFDSASGVKNVATNIPADALAGEILPTQLAAVPFAKIYLNAAQDVTTGGSDKVVLFETEAEDYAAETMLDLANNALIAPDDGMYEAESRLTWEALDGDGLRAMKFSTNDGGGWVDLDYASIVDAVDNNSARTSHQAREYIRLAAGDKVRVKGYQDSGSTIEIENGEYVSWFSLKRVGA